MRTICNLLMIFICSASIGFSQVKKTISSFPDKNDEDLFFNILFAKNGFYNDPFQLIKIEILEKPLFIIVSKGGFKDFFKIKYKVTDSVAENLEKKFLLDGEKLSLSDTTFFYPINVRPVNFIFYSNTLLEKYRKLELLDFLNSYCPIPSDKISMPVIGYMFEKRIFLDFSLEKIGPVSQSLLRSKYDVIWNGKEKKWSQSTESP